MAKEFEVIDIGYIGSFIEERADNDGDNLRKDVAISNIDNNVYVINPITGLLELNLNANPNLKQVTLSNPTGSVSSFVITNIGKTLKITNVTNTELCINTNNSTSNYVYNGVSFPSGSKSCQKSIYFTSHTHILWPRASDTQAILDDLTKKIPNDIGFSKKYYDIGYLNDDHLKKIETETKISMHFFKNLPVLFLFDTEFTDDVSYSSIKLSQEWDGYTVDKNNPNNLVYSDFYKVENADYANFVFLVPDQILNYLKEYFVSVSEQKTQKTDNLTKFNPTLWIESKQKEKEKYGQLVYFDFTSEQVTEENLLESLINDKLYEIDTLVTDIELVEDVSATDIFIQIIESQNKLFTINNELESVTEDNSQIDILETRLNKLYDLFENYNSKIIDIKYNINKKVFTLLESYFNFQISNNFPVYDRIIFNIDNFDSIYGNNRFIISPDDPFTEVETIYLVVKNEETNRWEILADILSSNTTQDNNINIENVSETTNFSTINFEQIDNEIFVYKRFSVSSDIKYSDVFFKTKPLFDIEKDRLNEIYIKDAPKNHLNWYKTVYIKNKKTGKETDIFNISFAHKDGLGSLDLIDSIAVNPSKIIYKKYMADCFGNQDTLIFENGKVSEYFYVIEFNRDVFKDKLDNTTLQFSFAPLSSSADQLVNTGSNFYVNQNTDKIFTIIDKSRITRYYDNITFDINEYYPLVEGTIQQSLSDNDESDIWGLVFPNKGLIILDGKTLDQSCSFNTVTASIDGDNINKVFLSMSGSLCPNESRTNHEYLYARSAELYSDQNYFCRVGQNEFNLTNNYTYSSGSNRSMFVDIINNTTKTYITTIGLYNDSKELLAVAKLSKPIIKDSGLEYIFNIKLKTN
jgi:hypothetical protein